MESDSRKSYEFFHFLSSSRFSTLSNCRHLRYGNKMAQFLGLNKGSHDASICMIEESQDEPEIEMFLQERFSRSKYAGWPATAGLRAVAPRLKPNAFIAENQFLLPPLKMEIAYNEETPYFEMLQSLGLSRFSKQFNSELLFVPHHYCHAMAAVEMSPFDRSLIVVLDGAGKAHRRPLTKIIPDPEISSARER